MNANSRKYLFCVPAAHYELKLLLLFAAICVHFRSFAFSFSTIKILLISLTFYSQIALAEIVDPQLRQRLITAINQSSSFDDRFHAEVWLLDMATRLKIRVMTRKPV